jgi:hypothetical protein
MNARTSQKPRPPVGVAGGRPIGRERGQQSSMSERAGRLGRSLLAFGGKIGMLPAAGAQDRRSLDGLMSLSSTFLDFSAERPIFKDLKT